MQFPTFLNFQSATNHFHPFWMFSDTSLVGCYCVAEQTATLLWKLDAGPHDMLSHKHFHHHCNAWAFTYIVFKITIKPTHWFTKNNDKRNFFVQNGNTFQPFALLCAAVLLGIIVFHLSFSHTIVWPYAPAVFFRTNLYDA